MRGARIGAALGLCLGVAGEAQASRQDDAVWRACMDVRGYDSSIAACTAIYEQSRNPVDRAAVLSNRGIARYLRGDYRGAIQDFDLSLQLDVSAEVLTNRASAYKSLRQYDRALADYDNAIARAPRLAAAWTGRGGVLVQMRRFADAVPDFDQALRLNHESVAAFTGRALAESQLGQYDRAVGDLTRAIALKPIADSYSARGDAYVGLKDYDHAIADYSRAVEIMGASGRAFVSKGNPDKVYGNYVISVEHRPLATVLARRGEAWFRKGDIVRALKDLDSAVAGDPKYAWAIYVRGVVRRAKGDEAGASADIAAARAIDPRLSGALPAAPVPP